MIKYYKYILIKNNWTLSSDRRLRNFKLIAIAVSFRRCCRHHSYFQTKNKLNFIAPHVRAMNYMLIHISTCITIYILLLSLLL